MDAHIKQQVSSCDTCQTLRKESVKAQIHPWIFPSKPWTRVHIDYAGPVDNTMYLVIVDAYSKYLEIIKKSSTTSTFTIKALQDIFARHGLPEIIVSDNGPQFKSSEFEQFCAN